MTLNSGGRDRDGDTAGCRHGPRNPRVFLKPGDVMRLGIEGLGEQQQTLVADVLIRKAAGL